MPRSTFSALLVCALLAKQSCALISEGELFADDDGPWVVGYFCYDFTDLAAYGSKEDAMRLDLSNFAPTKDNQTIVLYNQTKNSWDKAEAAQTCARALDVAYYNFDFVGDADTSATLSAQTVALGTSTAAPYSGYLEVYVALSTENCTQRELGAAWVINFSSRAGDSSESNSVAKISAYLKSIFSRSLSSQFWA